MEYGLGPSFIWKGSSYDERVLILLLMEYGLGQEIGANYTVKEKKS